MASNGDHVDLTCDTCDVSFQRSEHYHRHMRTHTKEKPFTCSECNQSFGRIDSLSRHHTTIHLGLDRQQRSDSQSEQRRVAQACKPCSISKVRCNGELPCRRCSQHGDTCYYEPNLKRKSTRCIADVNPPEKRSKPDDNHQPTQSVPEGNECSDPRPLVDGNADLPLSSVVQSDEARAPDLPFHLPSATEMACSTSGDEPIADMNEYFTGFDGTSSSIGHPPLMTDLESNEWLSQTMDLGFMSLFYQPLQLPSANDRWLDPLGPNANLNDHQASSLAKPETMKGLYSRSHSPDIDADAMEPRQYRPIAIEKDAQLAFPDLSKLNGDDIDNENLAHVEEVPAWVGERVSELAARIEQGYVFPRFINIPIPPPPVLNAWVQLYFEYFHPIFPLLHKPSFSASKYHWIVVFTTAAIGARFSKLRDAQACSRAMCELVRRITATMCEQENQNGRELWMIQTIILNHIALMYSGERRALEIAEFLQALPVTLGRRKFLFKTSVPMRTIRSMQLKFEQKWQLWVLDEERRRAAFAVWLLDSAFNQDFDLSNLMHLGELQISLPQTDMQWNAPDARTWARLAVNDDLGTSRSLKTVISDNAWKMAWLETGSIGKQVILRHLTRIASDQDGHIPHVPCFAASEKLQAGATLIALLALIENEAPEKALPDFKADTVHQIMGFAALMTHNSSTRHYVRLPLKFMYGKMQDESWRQAADLWGNAPAQGRLACFYAARILYVARSSLCAHFSVTTSLLRAVLVLWTYSQLAERFPDRLLCQVPVPSVVIGPKPLEQIDSAWVASGWSRVKLPGISNLLSRDGRHKLLQETAELMRSLNNWGISSTYTQLLTRLQETERQQLDGGAWWKTV
ncbi:fungal-specific transcription factor domain-containing protein [Truncatella angustata]|uniref:Fungal-specific transcription factor domain-containing protein n=1 Tax=Truncatella angustata TaxID=152316 RepID=A0A9P8UHI2_9PEZI|nr:fungal-specific transcription factor domain-containing protein [Truncatella angustata]KAH6652286.1 fungal-specific transcription factor domain-containing protein [Truncatella angustata]